MIGILILVLAVGWIARIARTRYASPWVFGSLAVIGFFAMPYVAATVLRRLFFQQPAEPSAGTIAAEFLVAVSRWLWVGAIALYVSTVPGRGKAQPRGRWSCPGCGWLNEPASLKCDACGTPYDEPEAPTVETPAGTA